MKITEYLTKQGCGNFLNTRRNKRPEEMHFSEEGRKKNETQKYENWINF